MQQTRLGSLAESTVNVVAGYLIAVGVQFVVYPWFGIVATLGEQLAIGLVFTSASLVRGYVIRRLFERWRRRS